MRKKREKKNKKPKDPKAPKRPLSAFFLWMNENREALKKKHPDLSLAEFGKKAGELWREMKDKSVSDTRDTSTFSRPCVSMVIYSYNCCRNGKARLRKPGKNMTKQ